MKKRGRISGIDSLWHDRPDLLRGKRFGLIAHQASVDATGCASSVRLRETFGEGLAALFSPEHGLFGVAGPGEKVDSARHPTWGIPVHSLYGATRRPSREMLAGLDTLVFDLQELSIRCYTYVSTLRYMLEAAAKVRVGVIVCDRGNPLVGVVDGPMLEPKFESFVGCFPGPLVYGMTSGQAARHLVDTLNLDVKLDVVYGRPGTPLPHTWISPSPAIRHPHSALCYPVTVAFEALPAVDYGRATLSPFEVIGAGGINEQELAERLTEQKLPGMLFHPVIYAHKNVMRRGVRLAVVDADAYRPVATAVAVLDILQQMIGKNVLWKTKGTRPAFFDQLFGTDAVRKALQAGISWRSIAASWRPAHRRWMKKVGR